MLPASLGIIFVIAVFAPGCHACILQQDWEPWNLTRRTQRADVVIVGTVINYFPIFRADDVTPLFYSAQIDASCVFGVNVDSVNIAKSLYDNNGVVNVTGFNARLQDCVRTDVEVNKEYIVMVVGVWNGGDMQPDQINAQPALFNSTADSISELAEAMAGTSYAGFQLKSRKCPVTGVIDIEEFLTRNIRRGGNKLPTTVSTGLLGATRLSARGAEPKTDGSGNGHRFVVHKLIIVLTFLFSVVMIVA